MHSLRLPLVLTKLYGAARHFAEEIPDLYASTFKISTIAHADTLVNTSTVAQVHTLVNTSTVAHADAFMNTSIV